MIFKHYSDFKGEWKWKNFTAKELSCNCCGEYYHDPYSLELIQRFRELLGRSITPNSAHRCKAHNDRVGGRANSMHLKIAFDLPLHGHDKKDFVWALYESGFTTFGLYASFIHTDIRSYKMWYGCKESLWGNIYNEIIKRDA